jgi:uncharacterized RDD family membrane protein YckC
MKKSPCRAANNRLNAVAPGLTRRHLRAKMEPMFKILGTDGKEYGPVTVGNVIEWIRDGRANLQTKARKGDETEWRTLGDFPEFVPTGSGPSDPAVPPPLVAEAFRAPEPAAALPQAGLLLRFSAALIDGVLQWICWMPASIAAARIISDRLADHQTPSLEMFLNASADSFGKSLPFLALLVVVQTSLLCLRSQSVGKLLMSLRIVTVRDGKPGGPLRAYLLRGLLIWVIEWVPIFGKLFWLVDSFFIFREDQRCLHDLIAGTKVVRLK